MNTTAVEIPLPPTVTPAHVLLAQLESCEATVAKGLKAIVDAGRALCAIRDQRLYIARGFNTFDQYCHEFLDFSASRAKHLCIGAETAGNVVKFIETSVTNGNHVPLPANERQLRPLMSLPPVEQGEAWMDAVKLAANGRLTSAHVEAAVKARRASLGPVRALADAITVESTVSTATGSTGTTGEIPKVPLISKEERKRAKADQAVAAVRELLVEIGTADSAVAGDVQLALETLQDLQLHLTQMGRFHQSREKLQ